MEKIHSEINQMEKSHAHDVIEQTALRLEKLQYAPPVPIDIPDFLRLDKTGLQKTVTAISSGGKEEQKEMQTSLQNINVLLYYYKRLLLLRDDDPEMWDEIDELYVHD